jgi:predicted DNA-binding ribbon-helix-helix protein
VKTKEKRLAIRLSEKRFEKIRQLAEQKEKTLTALIEDWIDSLPVT